MNSFRKRNIVITPRGPPGSPSAPSQPGTQNPKSPSTPEGPPPGVRPSPVNGQYTTSTGTPSLDSLLAGHAGLPLGCSLLIEEPGTTEYGGALLRYYAAEGIAQGHAITVIGFGESWARDLPAVTGDADFKHDEDKKGKSRESERMKIAWRYERLGDFGSGIGGSRAQALAPQRAPPPTSSSTDDQQAPRIFCHTFDLTKRLSIPATANLFFIPPPAATPSPPSVSPFSSILAKLSSRITSLPPTTPHRIIIPSLLNPALYPPYASTPKHLLQFIHSLRSLLRQHSQTLTIMLSLPTELYPRDTGLIRWVEILSDGVIELLPLPRKTASAARIGEEEPQGLVKLWKLPILGEKGGGVGATVGAGEDLAFLVTRRRFEIMAYSLPPADEEEGDGHSHGGQEGGKSTKVDLEF